MVVVFFVSWQGINWIIIAIIILLQTIKWLCLSTTMWGVGQIVWNVSSGWKLQIEKVFFSTSIFIVMIFIATNYKQRASGG